MTDKLATVERVLKVDHHPNADKLDIIRVLGYDCIVGRDSYKEGDLVVFIQPDSILPTDREWAQEPLRYCSKGRIKAIRLRGSWSMGLVINIGILPENMHEGFDATEYMGVTKYEPPLPKDAQAKGGLPFQIPKTDETRYQNLRDIPYGELVDVTQKIDGSSATYYCVLPQHHPGGNIEPVVGMTSRSLELKLFDDEGNHLNSRWHVAERRYDILEKLLAYCIEYGVSLAIRGEVYGEGIQSLKHNPHCREPVNFAMYSVYNIGERKYERREDGHYFTDVAEELDIPTVPIVEAGVVLTPDIIEWYDHGTKKLYEEAFEGVVINTNEGSFKVINKWYDAEKE